MMRPRQLLSISSFSTPMQNSVRKSKLKLLTGGLCICITATPTERQRWGSFNRICWQKFIPKWQKEKTNISAGCHNSKQFFFSCVCMTQLAILQPPAMRRKSLNSLEHFWFSQSFFNKINFVNADIQGGFQNIKRERDRSMLYLCFGQNPLWS